MHWFLKNFLLFLSPESIKLPRSMWQSAHDDHKLPLGFSRGTHTHKRSSPTTRLHLAKPIEIGKLFNSTVTSFQRTKFQREGTKATNERRKNPNKSQLFIFRKTNEKFIHGFAIGNVQFEKFDCWFVAMWQNAIKMPYTESPVKHSINADRVGVRVSLAFRSHSQSQTVSLVADSISLFFLFSRFPFLRKKLARVHVCFTTIDTNR